MPWSLWIVVGLALLAGEALTPGVFFIFFFGVAALIVGVLAFAGIAGAAWVQWLLFSVLSVAFVLLLRPRLVDRFSVSAAGSPALPDLVGDQAVLVEDLEPGAVGKAELRGSSWNVRSRHGLMVPRGSRCRVERVDGLTLWIAPPQGDY